jgi:hypothetical protein
VAGLGTGGAPVTPRDARPTIAGRIGSLLGLLGIVLLLPLIIIAVGLPVALVARLIAAIVERF